jgi:peptidoglycan-associated lipoprotein
MARPSQRACIAVFVLMFVLLPACARRPVGRTMSAPPPSPREEQLVAAGAQEGAAGAVSQEAAEAPTPVPTTPDTPSGLTASPSAVEEPPAEAGPSTATASPPREPAPEPEVTAPSVVSAPVEPPPADSRERVDVQIVAAAPTTPAPAPEAKPQEFQPVAGLNDIHFDFDEYKIRPEDARILDEDAAWLKTNRAALILIEGHADERGTSEYNLALGEHRAKAAKSYLVALGVHASRVTILSYGKERPLCVERNETCWSQNRRAHILVKPQ